MRLRNLIPCNAKLTLYKSAILPHLTYCHLIWNFCVSSESSDINQRRKRMKNFSLVLGYQLHITDVYKILLPWMYKVKNNLAPSCLSRLFKTKNSQYCLRNWDFEIPRFNTTGYGKHTIRYQGPYIWSKLSKELRTSPTLARLRQRVSSKTAISGLDVDFT